MAEVAAKVLQRSCLRFHLPSRMGANAAPWVSQECFWLEIGEDVKTGANVFQVGNKYIQITC